MTFAQSARQDSRRYALNICSHSYEDKRAEAFLIQYVVSGRYQTDGYEGMICESICD